MTAPLSLVQLAAGRSSRMGGRNKLLLRFGGETLVARTARILLRLDAGPVTVVLGHEADRVAEALAALPVATALSPDPEAGQMASVLAGLAAAPPAETYLLTVSDLPRLSLGDCRALLAAHDPAGSRITVPVRTGEDGNRARGHPILIPAALRARILAEGVSLGCRGLTRRHPDLVHPVEMAGAGCFADLDTPADLAAERRRRGTAIWGEDTGPDTGPPTRPVPARAGP